MPRKGWKIGASGASGGNDITGQVVEELREYFEGRTTSFAVPLEL